MSQLFIEELREVNLCTYYVLPLIKLSKFSFINSNFVNCYLSEDGTKVVVRVVEVLLVPRSVTSHSSCCGTYTDTRKRRKFIVFSIPQYWCIDVALFRQGKFSKMSSKAKESIRRFSGLDYKQRNGDQVLTDGRLLALDKHPVLKKMWEQQLTSVTPSKNGKSVQRSSVELPDDAELLSIPGKGSYISLESLESLIQI